MIFLEKSDEGDVKLTRWYWELLSWTAFCLWVFVLRMLRSVEWLSDTIGMVFACFEMFTSYMFVVIVGVLCFSNAFLAVR